MPTGQGKDAGAQLRKLKQRKASGVFFMQSAQGQQKETQQAHDAPSCLSARKSSFLSPYNCSGSAWQP